MKDLIKEYEERKAAVVECLEYYAIPIFIAGAIGPINETKAITTLSATTPREELIIRNNTYPRWLAKVFSNSLEKDNLLYITNFQDLSDEEQKLFVDIIRENRVSSEELPKNLKIVINSEYRCSIIPEIRDSIQYFEFL